MRANKGTFIGFSTSPGDAAIDGEYISPFASAFVDLLKIVGIDIEELFREVRQSVRLRTNGTQVAYSGLLSLNRFILMLR
jgi:hypothetical protein